MAKAERDMTTGTPWKMILAFFGPVLLSNLLQQFYNVIDTMVIGRFLGKNALAGVGATGSVNFLIVGFCIGVCMGLVIPVAQRFGAGDYSNMRKYIANAVWTLCIMGAIITIVVTVFCHEILVFMRTPSDVIDLAYEYIFIILCGIPITLAYNLLAGILRSLGDSKSPFVILLWSSVVNIGFDILSVAVLGMGIKGPAYATLLAQLFSAIMCFIVILRRFSVLKMQKGEWRFEAEKCKTLCKLGFPMGFQYSITAIGTIVLQMAINTLGTDAVASVAASMKISMFIQCPTESLGSAMATFGGQNLGAGRLDRVRKGLKATLLIGLCFAAFTLVFMLITVRFWVGLFVQPGETTVIAYSSRYILTNASFYTLLVGVNVIRFTIQGLGFSNFAMFAGIMEMIARVLVAVVLIPLFGFAGACVANAFAWFMADLFLVPAYFHVMKVLEQRKLKGQIVS